MESLQCTNEQLFDPLRMPQCALLLSLSLFPPSLSHTITNNYKRRPKSKNNPPSQIHLYRNLFFPLSILEGSHTFRGVSTDRMRSRPIIAISRAASQTILHETMVSYQQHGRCICSGEISGSILS